MFKVRRGDVIQDKEQQLHFAGTAVKRYPASKVRDSEEIPRIQGKRNPNEMVDGRYCEKASEGRHSETIITEK